MLTRNTTASWQTTPIPVGAPGLRACVLAEPFKALPR